jgi:lipopolysaccharide/colanic/teichoic acid biosynthesis glycosyltransferase
MSTRPRQVAGAGRQVWIARSAPQADRRARVLDVVVSGTALVVAAPLMAVIALVVAGTSRGGPLFRQVRVGRNEELFVMYKFRTMYAGCDDRAHREFVRRVLLGTAPPVGAGGVHKIVDDPRVTPVGRLLRRSSLDELPQLLNVLRGDMALVGPRPVLPWEAALFEPEHRARFLVRPGITGLWQVSGRSRLSMTQALDLDVTYVRTRCLRRDLRILLRTVPVVVSCRGAR